MNRRTGRGWAGSTILESLLALFIMALVLALLAPMILQARRSLESVHLETRSNYELLSFFHQSQTLFAAVRIPIWADAEGLVIKDNGSWEIPYSGGKKDDRVRILWDSSSLSIGVAEPLMVLKGIENMEVAPLVRSERMAGVRLKFSFHGAGFDWGFLFGAPGR